MVAPSLCHCLSMHERAPSPTEPLSVFVARQGVSDEGGQLEYTASIMAEAFQVGLGSGARQEAGDQAGEGIGMQGAAHVRRNARERDAGVEGWSESERERETLCPSRPHTPHA